ncbi:MAG: OsmC family protein [Candidatus Aminicenantales bacterium]
MIVRKSTAVWQGTLKEGKGSVSLGSGAFTGAYSFGSRFEDGTGTNPEELIGAAHAGCFSMALSGVLSQAGFPPREIATEARISMDKTPEGFTITRSDLVTEADVPGIDAALFAKLAEEAKKGCPVSRALKSIEITLQATLVARS